MNTVFNHRLPLIGMIACMTLTGCEGAPNTPSNNVVLSAKPTPGFEAKAVVHEGPLQCGAAKTPIYMVQGQSEAHLGESVRLSPLQDQRVEVEAILTGNFVSGMGGFFLQEPDAEADTFPSSSEGVFVMQRERIEGFARGMRVRVRGQVRELGDWGPKLTAIEPDVNGIVLCSDRSETLPAAVRFDQAPHTWNAYQGMRVTLPGSMYVLDNQELIKYGALTVGFSPQRLVPTEVFAPGPQARALKIENEQSMITLDDNRAREFPDRIWYLPQTITHDTPYRVGSVLQGPLTGIVDARHGKIRLQLEEEITSVQQAARPPAPAPVAANQSRIVGMNLLNFWNGDGRGGGFPTARGASDADELKLQTRKLVAALAALKPDVAALMEIENDGDLPRDALSELLSALNRELGKDGDYQAIEVTGGKIGIDVIRVGMIYRASRAEAIGAPALLDSAEFRDNARVPLAQTFRFKQGDTTPVTVVANHFKSKGSCDEAQGANQDQGDGQGCWNALRSTMAQQLLDWVNTNPTQSPSDQVLLIGDFNAYAMEDPIRLMKSKGYVDVVDAMHPENPTADSNRLKPYSFVYMGLAGRLDHALASPTLAARTIHAQEWHSNSSEMRDFDYNREDKTKSLAKGLPSPTPWRASDHDPVVVDLK